ALRGQPTEGGPGARAPRRPRGPRGLLPDPRARLRSDRSGRARARGRAGARRRGAVRVDRPRRAPRARRPGHRARARPDHGRAAGGGRHGRAAGPAHGRLGRVIARLLARSRAAWIVVSLLAILLAFVTVAIGLALIGADPIGAFDRMATAAIGSP